MYAWIWRKLPFGLPGKLVGSTLLILALGAGLWFWGFPKAEPLLPFYDVSVSDTQHPDGGGPAGVDPSTSPGQPGGVLPDDSDEDIPYPTNSNQPPPSSHGR
jgi:hypothetical protein